MTRLSTVFALAFGLVASAGFAQACEDHVPSSKTAPPRLSTFMNGNETRLLICNMTDEARGTKLIYTYENKFSNMLSELSMTRDGNTLTHAERNRPVWDTSVEYADDGNRIYFVATYAKDMRYKMVVNDRLVSYDDVEGFPLYNAAVVKEGFGPVSKGQCHVVLQ